MSDCYWTLSKRPAAGVCAATSPLTLNTNISRLKKATVLKLPSQMLGLPFPGSAGRLLGGCGGRECRSCLRSEVECVRREGKVGKGRVGSSMAVGMPGESRQSQHESVGHRDWFQRIIKSTETQRPTAAWVTGHQLCEHDFLCKSLWDSIMQTAETQLVHLVQWLICFYGQKENLGL